MISNSNQLTNTAFAFSSLENMIQGQASAAIYADSDVVFTKPIDELWAKMKSFKESEVMAIAPTAGHALGGSRFNENFIQHDTGLFQINSGEK